MPLSIGTRLGPYEILGPLGAGGMGEVYKAHDTNLGRDVAIKILPLLSAGDPDRLARFEREARTLAALNHPNIAQIFGLEASGSVRALAMELVAGEDLATRIGRGAVPFDEALPIARQITRALEAAHAQGIVHRDLKPANIKLRPDGTVKVLDFGLAKALEAVGGSETVSNSPTMMASMPGMLIGTAAYMSPEQARGKAVDQGADIWAFGCVLFEMLSGKRAFAGDNVSDVIAAVLKTEPDWNALPPETAGIRRLLGRCLTKDPRERQRDIADAGLEIDDSQHGFLSSAGAEPPRRRERLAWATALTLVLTAAVLVLVLARRDARSAPEMRLEIATPPTTDPASIAISPDGLQIAFVATDAGRPRLWLRSLHAVSARPLAGTEGAAFPFWAPHGRSIGFYADDGKLKRIDVDEGTVRVLANAPLQRGGTWNSTDTILFAPVTGSILRIQATGGEPTPVTRLDAQQSTQHSSPQFLPDGDHFVYYVSGSPDVRGVYVAAVSKPEGRRLVDSDAIAASVASGHLLFVRGTTLFAQPFDLAGLRLTGTPFPIAESIAMRTTTRTTQVAALSASAGRIVYRTASAALERQFVWFDRSGGELAKVGDPDGESPSSPSLSADQRRLAVHRQVRGNTDIWLLETGRGIPSRFTSNEANEIHPLWSPDGSRILFGSNRGGAFGLREKSTIGAGDEKLVLPMQAQATDWSRDGLFVLIQLRDSKTSGDIWALPMSTSQKPFPVVQTDFEERGGQFSPDGKWIAYESTESGRWEIFVQPFPGPGPKMRVSVNGGAQVRWRPDGKELFFIALDDRLMATPIVLPSNSGSPEVGVPVPLFATRVGGAVQSFSRQQYFVSPDGRRFLMNTILENGPSSPITIILNWTPQSTGGNR